MGQTKQSPNRAASALPRHALEAGEAVGPRAAAAVRRVAGKLAAALSAGSDSGATLRFEVASQASGRRDQFNDLLGGQADVAAITIEPVHAPALLIADHGLSAFLVERHYGGRIEALGSATMRRPGLAEAREFARLAEAFAAALQQSCDDRVPMSATHIGPLPPDDATELLGAGEAVARIDFAVTLPPSAIGFTATLMLPLAALRAASVLQVALGNRDTAARNRWQADLARRAGDIAMPARSIIARPLLSMQQLMALRPGDVIPIGMPRSVPLLVADRRVATGTIGERDGRVAFMIDHLEREDAR